ncbi:MAG: hypothetical protein Kow00121_40630 [Elainellaceae cyanobacterium]
MNDRTNSQPSSSKTEKDQQDTSPDAPQPESGFVDDRQERMEVRQSSPTNPRVQDKPEVDQEEA